MIGTVDIASDSRTKDQTKIAVWWSSVARSMALKYPATGRIKMPFRLKQDVPQFCIEHVAVRSSR